MQPSLRAGLSHEAVLTINDDLTIPNVSSRFATFDDSPPIFATALMIGFIETTCVELLASHLDEDECSVWTHVDVSHTAATPIGMTVTAKVRLIDVEGRMLTFKVEAQDETADIGRGTHRRAVIDYERFMERIKRKGRHGADKAKEDQK